MHTGRILWGLVLLALGGVLLAGQLGVLDAGAVVAGWWPVVVIAAGLLRLAGRPRDVTGATIVVVIGLILLGWRQDLVNLSIVLPIALIAAGLWILFRRGGRRPASLEDRSLDVTAAFGGREVRVASRRFEGGRIVATFGGAEVDLRDAVLSAGHAGNRITLRRMVRVYQPQPHPLQEVALTSNMIIGSLVRHHLQ